MLVRKFRGFSPSLVAVASAASFSILPSSCVKAVDVVEMRKNVIDFLDNFLVGKNYVSFKEESSENKIYSFSMPLCKKYAVSLLTLINPGTDKFNFFKIVVKEKEVECHFIFNKEKADQCCQPQKDVFKRIPLDKEDVADLVKEFVSRVEKIHAIYSRIKELWDQMKECSVFSFSSGVDAKTGNLYFDFANNHSDFDGVGAYIGMKQGPVQLRKIRICNNGKQMALVYRKEGVDELKVSVPKVEGFVKHFYYIENEDDLDSLYDVFFGESFKGWEIREPEEVSPFVSDNEDEAVNQIKT